MPRWVPTTAATLLWKAGRAKNWLGPAPASLQLASLTKSPAAVRLIVVPPAATTLGATAGKDGNPASPVEAKNATPAWVNGEVNVEPVSPPNSLLPQLFDISPPPAAATRAAAFRSAKSRSVNELLAASTRITLALGASACAISTSSAISRPQPSSRGGRVPVANTTWKLELVIAGSPNCAA